ncbi:MAG: hypothetical protein VX438_12770, partial [Planctomycetota bacterium]|nr:hypothetical protein [Planctomycetota bacterium]
QRLSEEQAKRESIANRSVKLFSRWLTDEENPGTFQNAENCWKAYALSWALVIIGIFLLGPVIYTMLGWIGKDYHLPLGRWSLLLVFLSAFQFLYAVFLFQIPDWTTTRLVSYLMLAMTVFSTCLLAITLLSQENSSFFKYLQLSIVDKGKISSWLTVMSIGFGMMSYLCGRTTQQWMKEESRRRLPVQSTLV